MSTLRISNALHLDLFLKDIVVVSVFKLHYPRTCLLIPALAGCAMIAASILPWLNDPLGTVYSAWSIPIDVGWQLRSSLLNYGLLCFCGACTSFFLAYSYWKRAREEEANAVGDAAAPFAQWYLLAVMLCAAPLLLFILQYLCADLHGMDLLAQHKTQMLLIQQHFGYKGADQPIQIRPFQVDSTTVSGRFTLLINQMSVGLLLPLLSACLLLYGSRAVSTFEVSTTRRRLWLIRMGIGTLALGIILGRAPASLFCQYQAKTLLATGDYASASQWLDRAYALNPTLDQTPYYHRERGWIWYFLHPNIPNDDSHTYLAYLYRTQNDYLAAYQELLAVWRSEPTTFWIVDEMSLTLAQQAETVSTLNYGPIDTSDFDISSLPWLRLLALVDRSNVYSQYAIARIQYNQHNYDACMAQMATVLQLSNNTDVQSSAYTYMALSLSRQGKINEARQILLKAIEFDPAYHNNTAREELSGLH